MKRISQLQFQHCLKLVMPDNIVYIHHQSPHLTVHQRLPSRPYHYSSMDDTHYRHHFDMNMASQYHFRGRFTSRMVSDFLTFKSMFSPSIDILIVLNSLIKPNNVSIGHLLQLFFKFAYEVTVYFLKSISPIDGRYHNI